MRQDNRHKGNEGKSILRRYSNIAVVAISLLAACESQRINDVAVVADQRSPAFASGGGSVLVVNVSDDTTAQNETPLAVNPRNAQNLLTGNNDWNYNDGCGVNVSFDGGKNWTK